MLICTTDMVGQCIVEVFILKPISYYLLNFSRICIQMFRCLQFLNIKICLCFVNLCLIFSSVDFPPAYQNWEGTDPMDLFEAPVLRSECNPKVMCLFTTLIETECNLVNC